GGYLHSLLLVRFDTCIVITNHYRHREGRSDLSSLSRHHNTRLPSSRGTSPSSRGPQRALPVNGGTYRLLRSSQGRWGYLFVLLLVRFNDCIVIACHHETIPSSRGNEAIFHLYPVIARYVYRHREGRSDLCQ